MNDLNNTQLFYTNSNTERPSEDNQANQDILIDMSYKKGVSINNFTIYSIQGIKMAFIQYRGN